MGTDITLYPKKASRDDLKKYVEDLGFKKCKHFWDWPKGTLNYSWFDAQDFRSISGVSADVYPVAEKERGTVGNEWALHVRSASSASWYDVKMLNTVLRGARQLFGGSLQGDFGTNKYAPLWDDKSTPISRGVSAIFQRVDEGLRSVKFALPEAKVTEVHTDTNTTDRRLRDFINSFDPSRVLYNGLVPFAVSMFEFFFSRAFRVLISYDKHALEKRASYKAKVDFSTLLRVGGGKSTIEDVIADEYTFQNLDQLNKAYKDWLDIDVRKLLYKKRRLGKKVSFLENRIHEIIQYRHGVVHHFELDRSLTKEGYIAILDAVEASILEFVGALEAKYKIEIDRH